MTFDPFGDFRTKGYLRNFARAKDPAAVKRLEHEAFTARVNEAVTKLRTGTALRYQDALGTHKRLFQDVYPWAGQDRSVTAPDLTIGKGGRFDLFAGPGEVRLAAEHALRVSQNPDAMRAKPGEVMGYLAYAHPFLDGNGRTIMVIHGEMCRRAEMHIDWRAIPKELYLGALTKELTNPGRGHLDNLLRPHVQLRSLSRGQDVAMLRSHPGLGPRLSAPAPQAVAEDKPARPEPPAASPPTEEATRPDMSAQAARTIGETAESRTPDLGPPPAVVGDGPAEIDRPPLSTQEQDAGLPTIAATSGVNHDVPDLPWGKEYNVSVRQEGTGEIIAQYGTRRWEEIKRLVEASEGRLYAVVSFVDQQGQFRDYAIRAEKPEAQELLPARKLDPKLPMEEVWKRFGADKQLTHYMAAVATAAVQVFKEPAPIIEALTKQAVEGKQTDRALRAQIYNQPDTLGDLRGGTRRFGREDAERQAARAAAPSLANAVSELAAAARTIKAELQADWSEFVQREQTAIPAPSEALQAVLNTGEMAAAQIAEVARKTDLMNEIDTFLERANQRFGPEGMAAIRGGRLEELRGRMSGIREHDLERAAKLTQDVAKLHDRAEQHQQKHERKHEQGPRLTPGSGRE